MNLSEYFERTRGVGVLATADSSGIVDAAVYARPHMMDENTAAFIMHHRLTYHNLQSNPHAAYLFIEEGSGYQGRRLYLTRIREERDRELIEQLRRRCPVPGQEDDDLYLVYFRVDKIRPLVGNGAQAAED